MYDIFSQVLMPLSVEDTESEYPWLLEGTERDSRQIRLSGLSAKCLHTYAQVTHLAARLAKVRASRVSLGFC